MIVAKAVALINNSPFTRLKGELDVYSINVLQTKGNPIAMAQTMLFKLWSEGYLESIDESGRVLFKKTDKSTDKLLQIESAFLEFFENPSEFKELLSKKNNIQTFEPFIEELKKGLADYGFVKGNAQLKKEKIIRYGFYIVMIALGATKLFLGIANNKPVSFLIFLMIFMTVMFFLVNRPDEITSKGKEYLREKRGEHYSFKENKGSGTNFSSEQAAIAVALFGLTSMYFSPEFGMIARAAQIPNAGSWGGSSCTSTGCSSSGCSSSSCSSSGCSSSSCGGGGCGGGGCGGCGGGD